MRCWLELDLAVMLGSAVGRVAVVLHRRRTFVVGYFAAYNDLPPLTYHPIKSHLAKLNKDFPILILVEPLRFVCNSANAQVGITSKSYYIR